MKVAVLGWWWAVAVARLAQLVAPKTACNHVTSFASSARTAFEDRLVVVAGRNLTAVSRFFVV